MQKEYMLKIIPLIQERIKHLTDISNQIWFFFDEHFHILEKNTLIPKGYTKEDLIKIIEHSMKALEITEPFNIESLENSLREVVHLLNMKAGPVFMTLRVAITGTKISPGIFETMSVLGKDRVIRRLNEALEIVKHDISQ